MEGAAGGMAWWKFGAATLAAGTAGLAAASSIALADEAEHGLHAPAYPWPHDGFFRCAQAQRRVARAAATACMLTATAADVVPAPYSTQPPRQDLPAACQQACVGIEIASSGAENCRRQPGQP